MKTVCFFNNKGGVGKTTLACNIAAHFAKTLSKRVLVIDCDPQCNSTQLIIGDDKITEAYWPIDAKEANQNSHFHTILDVVTPIQEGDASINSTIEPLLGSDNKFGVDIIPGHPKLSAIEDILGQAWYESMSGQIGGIRKSNWCYALFQSLKEVYDVAFIDLGPSLGSINRSVLLGSDYFCTPLGPDVFSFIGIRNIADWLREWIERYEIGIQLYHKNTQPSDTSKYQIRTSVALKNGYCGYTLQQYVTKSLGGIRRPTVAFERILREVPAEINKSLISFFPSGVNSENAKLGDVPYMYSIIPLAQSANSPIISLEHSDGLAGAQFKQVGNYKTLLSEVSQSLAENIGLSI